MHNVMVSVDVSLMGKTVVIFIEPGAKVSNLNVFLVKDCCLISEPSVVTTDGLSSRMVYHRTQRKKHAWVVQQHGGHIEHIAV